MAEGKPERLRIVRIDRHQPKPMTVRPVSRASEKKAFLTAAEAGMPAVPKLRAERIRIKPEPPAA